MVINVNTIAECIRKGRNKYIQKFNLFTHFCHFQLHSHLFVMATGFKCRYCFFLSSFTSQFVEKIHWKWRQMWIYKTHKLSTHTHTCTARNKATFVITGLKCKNAQNHNFYDTTHKNRNTHSPLGLLLTGLFVGQQCESQFFFHNRLENDSDNNNSVCAHKHKSNSNCLRSIVTRSWVHRHIISNFSFSWIFMDVTVFVVRSLRCCRCFRLTHTKYLATRVMNLVS